MLGRKQEFESCARAAWEENRGVGGHCFSRAELES